MFQNVQIENNFNSQHGLDKIYGQISNILNHHAPEKELDFNPKGSLPMVSVDQAAQELLSMLKNS
jgi:hypothetical protein